jgi:large subunit ribosomal protein L14e
MYEIGRLCVKIAGRDSRQKCLIIDVLEGNFVMIDGQTRRRKCNIMHLEPLDQVLKIKKNASHSDVVDALKKEGIEVIESKTKENKEKPSKKAKEKTETIKEPSAKKEKTPKTEEKKVKKASKPKDKEN